MSRVSLFNSPLLLGFDHVERTLDRLARHGGDGYPPYNIEQTGDSALRITLAVAGFSPGELEVQIEDNQLVIRGRQAEDQERVYLHRGIAARQFQRSFVLADGIEVTGATLDAGLLHIDLVRPRVEALTRNIEIRTPGGQAGDGQGRKPRTGSQASSQAAGSQAAGPQAAGPRAVNEAG